MLETFMPLVGRKYECFAVLSTAAVAIGRWCSQHCSTRHKSPRWSLCDWHRHECNCFVCPNIDGYFDVTDGKEGWKYDRNSFCMELWFLYRNCELWYCLICSDLAHLMQLGFLAARTAISYCYHNVVCPWHCAWWLNDTSNSRSVWTSELEVLS